VVAQIEGMGRKAVAVQADVRHPEAAEAMIKKVVEELGGLHIIVNNAGITRDNLMMRMKESDWDDVIDINLKGAFNVIKAAQRPLMKGRYGRIINITSVSGIGGNAGQANYASAKAGMIGLTKSVAKELGSRGITCNAVAPGYVPTDLTADLPAELLEQAVKLTPLGRLGTAQDIANAVAFFADDASGFITGQVLSVDGGMMF
jgi:3-oxoacyl-[acyl-carrier protein] reductase